MYSREMARELVFTFKEWSVEFEDGDLAGAVEAHPETAPRISMALTCRAADVSDPADPLVRTMSLPFHKGHNRLEDNIEFRMAIHKSLSKQTCLIMALHADTSTAFHVKADEIMAEAGINVFRALHDREHQKRIVVDFFDMAAKASNATNPYHKGRLIIDKWSIDLPEDVVFTGDHLDSDSHEEIVAASEAVTSRYYDALGIGNGPSTSFPPLEKRLEDYHVPWYAASLPGHLGAPVMLPSSFVYDQKPVGSLSEEAALRLLRIGMHDVNLSRAEYLAAVQAQRAVPADSYQVREEFTVAIHATFNALSLITNSYPYAYDVSSTRDHTAWKSHSNHFRQFWKKKKAAAPAYGVAPAGVTAEKDHAILAPLGDSGIGVDCEDGANMIRALRRQIIDMRSEDEVIRAAAYILDLFEVVIARAYCGDHEGSSPDVDAGVCHIVAIAIPYSTFCGAVARGLALGKTNNRAFAGSESAFGTRCATEAASAPQWVACMGVFGLETTNTTEPFLGVVDEHYPDNEERSKQRLKRLVWLDDVALSNGHLPELLERDWMYRLQVRHLSGQFTGSHTASTFLDEPYQARLHGFYWAFTTCSVDMRSRRLFDADANAVCSDMAFVSDAKGPGRKSWGILSQVLALDSPDALALVPLSWSTAKEVDTLRRAVDALNFPSSLHTTEIAGIPAVHKSPRNDMVTGPVDSESGEITIPLRAAIMKHHLAEPSSDHRFLKLYALQTMIDTAHVEQLNDYLSQSAGVVGFDYAILNFAHRQIRYLDGTAPITKASRLYEFRIYYDTKR